MPGVQVPNNPRTQNRSGVGIGHMDNVDARMQRALRMQEDATQLHERHHGEERPVDIESLIAEGENIIKVCFIMFLGPKGPISS